MDHELADELRGTVGQLGSLIKVIAENIGITEEQAAAVGLLADLPERDVGLTRQVLDDGAFQLIFSRVVIIQKGETRGSHFVTPFLEGLAAVLARVTFVLAEEPSAMKTILLLCSWNCFSPMDLTKLPELPPPGFCYSIGELIAGIQKFDKTSRVASTWFLCPCFSKQPAINGLCRLHRRTCSLKESFCLLEGQAVEKLVALLDHTNEKVVEAALAALSTFLDDGVNVEQGVLVLCETQRVKPILDILLEKRTENLRRRSVWTVERILRTDDIANEVYGDPNVSTALVDAFQHADYWTLQIDKIPNFSGIFTNMG